MPKNQINGTPWRIASRSARFSAWSGSASRQLHQPVFRATVLRAYERRCAVCALRHEQLLDAAHIVPDREETGIAAVPNGLALCKIHHAAYDCLVLGIRPDLVVEVRADLLEEIDGPVLEHGPEGRHGQALMALPRVPAERPDRDLLDERYAASARPADLNPLPRRAGSSDPCPDGDPIVPDRRGDGGRMKAFAVKFSFHPEGREHVLCLQVILQVSEWSRHDLGENVVGDARGHSRGGHGSR